MAAFTVSRSSLPCLFLARVLILLAFHSPSAAFKGKEQTFLNFFSPSTLVHSVFPFASLLSFGMHFYKKKKKFNVIIIIIFFCRRLLFFFLKRMEEKRQTCHCVDVKCNINVCFIAFVFGFLVYIIIFTEFFSFFFFFDRTLIFFFFGVKKTNCQSVMVFKKTLCIFISKKKKKYVYFCLYFKKIFKNA